MQESGLLRRCRSSQRRGRLISLSRRGEVARAALAARAGEGIKAQNRCGCPAAARRSLWQKSGANESREQLCPAAIAAMYGRHLLQCKNEKAYSRGRQTNVQLLQFCTAWGRCMAWGRRQTQNVHCSCLYVYTRTAVSCMGRSARVQRGQAIICSTAAGANCRSVTCARSAH